MKYLKTRAMKIEKGNVDGAAERSGGITFLLFQIRTPF